MHYVGGAYFLQISFKIFAHSAIQEKQKKNKKWKIKISVSGCEYISTSITLIDTVLNFTQIWKNLIINITKQLSERPDAIPARAYFEMHLL